MNSAGKYHFPLYIRLSVVYICGIGYVYIGISLVVKKESVEKHISVSVNRAYDT